jgi:hypothetical protein
MTAGVGSNHHDLPADLASWVSGGVHIHVCLHGAAVRAYE